MQLVTTAGKEVSRARKPLEYAAPHGSVGERNVIVRALKGIIPPILIGLARNMTIGEKHTRLFGGDSDLFESAMAEASFYAEYGCGQSTSWVAKNTSLPISSVDSSAYWIAAVQDRLDGRQNVSIKHVDFGPVGDWGRPLGYANRSLITEYTEAHFGGDKQPDLILIDGRFRVACFLASLLHAKPGSVILFDDYTDRQHYHIVEEFLLPSATCGRQARFEVPGDLPKEQVRCEYEKFLYVMD